MNWKDNRIIQFYGSWLRIWFVISQRSSDNCKNSCFSFLNATIGTQYVLKVKDENWSGFLTMLVRSGRWWWDVHWLFVYDCWPKASADIRHERVLVIRIWHTPLKVQGYKIWSTGQISLFSIFGYLAFFEQYF